MAKSITEFMGEVPRAWNAVAVSAALVASGYCWFTYTTVFRWVCEAQMATLGQYSTKLSIVLTVLINMVVFGALVRLLVALGVVRKATDAEVQAHVERTMAQRQGVYSPFMFAIMLAPWGLIGIGAGLWARVGSRETAATTLTHKQVLSGDLPGANFVSIGGHLVPDGRVTFGSTVSAKNYIPLLPLDWSPNDPVKVFIETSEVPPEGMRVVSGMRWPLGLPGPVRVEFEKGGIDVSGAVLINVNSTPREWGTASLILLIMGGVGTGIAGACLVVAVVKRRRAGQTVQRLEPVAPA